MPSSGEIVLVSIFAQAGGGGGGGGLFDNIGALGAWLPFVLIGILFYLMLVRPERRKRAEMQQMLGNLKSNDRVVTIGGIYGIVVNAQKESDYVTIKVDESSNTKLRILRSAISRIITTTDAEKVEKST